MSKIIQTICVLFVLVSSLPAQETAAMLKANNELRVSAGLEPQIMSAKLTKAAQFHADYMARTLDFSHDKNLGLTGRIQHFGYDGTARENIAYGSKTVALTFDIWHGSRRHRSNIICDAPQVGFGHAVSAYGTPFWVSVYGYPAK